MLGWKMVRKPIRALAILIASNMLLLAVVGPKESDASWAVGYSGAYMLRDCSKIISGPCVESIFAKTQDGLRIQGLLTGRYADEFYISGTQRFSDEYSFPGVEFESPAGNRLINRTYFDGKRIQVVLEASWLDRNSSTLRDFRISMPKRETDLWCGTIERPAYCYRSVNFDRELEFEIRLRIPSSFQVAYVNGRGKEMKVESGLEVENIAGDEVQRVRITLKTLKMSQMNWSDLIPNPLASSEWAEWESDQTNTFIYSSEHPVTLGLVRCAGVPSVSVISNGFYADVPQWDPYSSSLTVKVSGPHYKSDGQLNLGFFQAQISAKLAKCLWGIDLSGQVKGQISILESSDGAQDVQTLLGHFDGNSYILTATNFHYSTQTISMKLLKESPSGPVRVARTTIVCVKVKSVKRVSGLRPVCPVGFKRRP